MQYAEWNSDYRTGVGSVDYDHRRLMDTINLVCASLSDQSSADPVLDSLGLLYERTSAHCALEEKFLRGQGDQRYSNKAQHEDLLEGIGAMMDAFYAGSCGACDRSLDACLRAWFEKHLQTGHGHLKAQRT
jgi:hemerythrin-like metal-binding protein